MDVNQPPEDPLKAARRGLAPGERLRRRIGFFDIPEVRRVEAAVQALRADRRPDRPTGGDERGS